MLSAIVKKTTRDEMIEVKRFTIAYIAIITDVIIAKILPMANFLFFVICASMVFYSLIVIVDEYIIAPFLAFVNPKVQKTRSKGWVLAFLY